MTPWDRREIMPELLDSLPDSDPEARRSRRELEVINRWMGNNRWFIHELKNLYRPGLKVVELGAGNGSLALLARKTYPEISWGGLDLAPRPEGWPSDWHWVEGDLFEEAWGAGDVLVVNLFLHHFNETQLARLCKRLQDYPFWLVNEPLRRSRTQIGFHLLSSLYRFGRVTRHDAVVSIRAGFRRGELPNILGAEATGWLSQEQETCLGALRWRMQRTGLFSGT